MGEINVENLTAYHIIYIYEYILTYKKVTMPKTHTRASSMHTHTQNTHACTHAICHLLI